MQALKNFDELVALIKPHSNIVMHSGFSDPNTLAQGLADHAGAFQDVSVFSLLAMGSMPYAYATGGLAVKAFFPGPNLRRAVNSGQATLIGRPLSEIAGFFAPGGGYRADFLFLQLSPPDESGRMTLGITVDYMRAVLAQDPIVVAEINPLMPRTAGDTQINPEDVDYILESAMPPLTVEARPGDQVDQKIADNVAGLIESGAVLQVGIGSLPDLVLARLSHLHDLGLHSGILTDAIVPLIKSGVINNARKTEFRGRSVTTMVGGSQAFYDFLNDNPLVEFHPSWLTHGAATLEKIEGLCAINSVIEIDLQARANGEKADGRVISAPGGLPDFAHAAARARGGQSIIALRSTAKHGTRNNIVASLQADVPATLTSSAIDFVVTEHGIARLRGLSLSAIAQELIEIADPAFRADLRRSIG